MKLSKALVGLITAIVSFGAFAAADETKVKSRTNAEYEKEITSAFSNLTPEAIAAGLRDLVIIGTVKKDENNQPNITWHSISKSMGNDNVAAKLSETLSSPKITALPKVGEEFDIVGNLDSLLSDYQKMVSAAKKNDITLKEEAAEKDSTAASGSSGSSSGGYFEGSETESPNTGADDFIVKPDTTFTRVAECAINYDFNKLIASEMSKTETVSNNTGEVISETDCAPTGVTYMIQADFSTKAKCTSTTDYTERKHYLGFRYYIDKSGLGNESEYVSECKTAFDNPLDILQDLSDCGVSENLTNLTANVNKKWFYTENGGQVFITDCMPSDEIYPIAESDSNCVPYLNENLGNVYIQSQLVWTDNQNNTHSVTECRPLTTELQTQKEFSGQLEHDFVGGVSYEMSRDYYVYNGETFYINEFSRDPSVSYSHYRTTDGCVSANDDANLRSRVYTQTLIDVKGQTQVIKGCEAENQYIPYTYLSTGLENWNVFNGRNYVDFEKSDKNGATITSTLLCNRTKTVYPSFTWQSTSTGSVFRIGQSLWFRTTATADTAKYLRSNGTVYSKTVTTYCKIAPTPVYSNDGESIPKS